MTDDYGIVSFWCQPSSKAVGDRYITKGFAGFKGERGYNGDFLVRDERRKRVLRLPGGPLYGI